MHAMKNYRRQNNAAMQYVHTYELVFASAGLQITLAKKSPIAFLAIFTNKQN